MMAVFRPTSSGLRVDVLLPRHGLEPRCRYGGVSPADGCVPDSLLGGRADVGAGPCVRPERGRIAGRRTADDSTAGGRTTEDGTADDDPTTGGRTTEDGTADDDSTTGGLTTEDGVALDSTTGG